jgi:predicted dehydrogenase
MGSKITRRAFSAGAIGIGAAATVSRAAAAVSGANERIRLGIIGVGNRGDQLIDAFLPHKDAQIVALCDVYQPYLDAAAKKVGGELFLTKHFREVIDRKDVDAIVIATPDHWHAIPFIDACAAGKDVYVEKPLSLVVNEGKAMIAAARKYKRVTQVGIHRRSAPNCMKAAELIQGGAIGKVTSCRCFHISNEWPVGIGNTPDTDPPAGLDWDLWLGPAPKVPYNEKRCLYKFRWFRAYSGGQMTNFGTHWLDLIHMVLGQNAPRGVFAVGSNATIKDGRGVPETMEAVWDYPDGMLVSYSQYNSNAAPGAPNKAYVEFRGTTGTLYYTGSKMEIVPEAVRVEPVPPLEPTNRKGNARQAAATRPSDTKAASVGGGGDTADHARDFLDCVKSRKECRCSIEIGHRSTVATLIANIACDRKKYLAWDGEAERFTNDDEANKALAYEYRAPWKFPEC